MRRTPLADSPARGALGSKLPDVCTFVVESEEFELPKLFIKLHSPVIAQRFEDEPGLERMTLEGSADSFRVLVKFLRGARPGGEVTRLNIKDLMYWSRQLGVEYITTRCEERLLRDPCGFEPLELLALASEHGMPLLYARLVQEVGQGSHHLEFESDVFSAKHVRDDVVGAHVSMGLYRGDLEARRRHRFADHTGLNHSAARQRARLAWKCRHRLQPPSTPPIEHDWRSTECVWPHHSFRGADWATVPAETQPVMPLRLAGMAAIRQVAPGASQ